MSDLSLISLCSWTVWFHLVSLCLSSLKLRIGDIDVELLYAYVSNTGLEANVYHILYMNRSLYTHSSPLSLGEQSVLTCMSAP